MRFAIADPPYLGCGGRHYTAHHPLAADCDKPEWHAALIRDLCSDWPDGWALCLSSPSLAAILPMCPSDVRVAAWVKPWASFKPNVNPGYAWEPVIWRGGRKWTRKDATVRDWLAENATMLRGLPGCKPHAFGQWLMDLLNVQPGDTVNDLFPGAGGIGAAISQRLQVVPPELELIP